MGRFETTVEFYRYREPYPPEFFEVVAERLGLNRNTRLLDVGCGPGVLAIGFARFVGTCTAIDREPEMLREANRASAAARAHIAFVETTIEDLNAPDDSFDFVTIGRALHWLDPRLTLAVLEKILRPGGRIAICGSSGDYSTPAKAWQAEYKRLRRSWSADPDESRYHLDFEQWFAPSRFRKLEDIVVEHSHCVPVDHLVKRMFSFSTTSPALIGDKRPQLEAEVRRVLAPFARDGSVEEQLAVKATIFG